MSYQKQQTTTVAQTKQYYVEKIEGGYYGTRWYIYLLDNDPANPFSQQIRDTLLATTQKEPKNFDTFFRAKLKQIAKRRRVRADRLRNDAVKMDKEASLYEDMVEEIDYGKQV